jgi:FSR family fosmidomycin resistance protein-like MFS transporter
VEFVDELADGTKGAALPLIRADLNLSYAQIGLLIAVPLLAGSLLELPMGLVAGSGKVRQRLVLVGGLVVIGSLAAVAAATSVGLLMLAFVAFFPASGAFVSLTQAALMDAASARQQQRMAAWNLAGSAGAVGGPLLLAAVLAAGGDWRSAYLLLAAAAGAAVVAAAIAGPARHRPAQAAQADRAPDSGAGPGPEAPGAASGANEGGRRPSAREVARALRTGDTARWLILLQVSDLLLDVLTGYIGVYLVDVAHASPAEAAVGVAIRLGAGLAGDAAFVLLSRRAAGPAVLRISAVAACALYPAFLLAPWLPARLAILAVLSFATACWYPVVQAGLYESLPGQSGIAVFFSSAAGLVGAVGPLTVGLVAQQAGLSWALAGLAVAPALVLVVLPRPVRARSR